jgi:hypothetical protein
MACNINSFFVRKLLHSNKHNVVLYLQIHVDGSRWTNIRDKATHEAEKVGKEAGKILEQKAAEKAADFVIDTLVKKG